VLERSEGGRTLVVVGAWGREAESVLASGAADGLVLNYARGFQERTLDFLGDWPLRRLTILARTINHLTPLYRLAPTLGSVSIEVNPSAEFDLGRMPKLTGLAAADWGQVRGTIGELSDLVDLYVGGYVDVDLTPLRWNRKLSSVRMKNAPRLSSLDGVEHLLSLTQLAIHGARQLQDLSALADHGPPLLEELQLQACRGARDLSYLERFAALRFLNIAECGDIESLRPLSDLRELQSLWAYGSTSIVDGDLRPLLDLPVLTDLRLMGRTHYRPTLHDVEKHIANSPQR
jgi:internalin A